MNQFIKFFILVHRKNILNLENGLHHKMEWLTCSWHFSVRNSKKMRKRNFVWFESFYTHTQNEAFVSCLKCFGLRAKGQLNSQSFKNEITWNYILSITRYINKLVVLFPYLYLSSMAIGNEISSGSIDVLSTKPYGIIIYSVMMTSACILNHLSPLANGIVEPPQHVKP